LHERSAELAQANALLQKEKMDVITAGSTAAADISRT
jgi:hypothetical protein